MDGLGQPLSIEGVGGGAAVPFLPSPGQEQSVIYNSLPRPL